MKAGLKGGRWLMAPIAAVVAIAAVSTIAFANQAFKEPKPPKGIDPVYGVCRGTDPACYNDWGTVRDTRVLVYSRTAGPRHQNLGPRLDPDHSDNAGLTLERPYIINGDHFNAAVWPVPLTEENVAQAGLIRLLEAQGIAVDVTEDVQAIESLGNNDEDYMAVIFMSPTRDTLWNHASGAAGGTRLDRAREQLKKYVEGGGGFVGIHNAFGTEYGWQWYEGLLGNANYYSHGANQAGDVVIVNDRDVSTAGLPERWGFEDEWYNLIPFPTNVNFLAVVDESTLVEDGPGAPGEHPGHGDFHPVSWCQYYDGGRSWVTTLGHSGDAFLDPATTGFPGAAEFQQHIVAGIKSAMGLEPFCTPAKGRR
ncbi:MAG TPA: ThuA domain-containing protein [Ilumatobacteraceae bacterium]|nr:ThuA domain-containing protein [Ilumatobacteraceae bacterium]